MSIEEGFLVWIISCASLIIGCACTLGMSVFLLWVNIDTTTSLNNSTLEHPTTFSNAESNVRATEPDTNQQHAPELLTTFDDIASMSTLGNTSNSHAMSALQPYFTPTIKEWLETPREISSFAWNEGATGQIKFFSFPLDLFTKAVYWDKIKRFGFMRAGVKLAFRINGTQFHYGRLVACYAPLGSGICRSHSSHFNFYSGLQLPHVQLSPTENMVEQLEIPFNIPCTWWNLDKYADSIEPHINMSEIARVAIYVLNPLRSVSDSVYPVHVTVFASFTNVELSCMSYTDLAVPTYWYPDILIEKNLNAKLLQEQTPIYADPPADDMKLEGHVSFPEITAKVRSGVADIVGTVGAVVSAGFTLAKIVAPVAVMFADKPDTTEVIHPGKVDFNNFASTDGVDTSRSLGLSMSNRVKPILWMDSNVSDSYSLTNIVGVPGLIDQFVITDSSLNLVANYRVSPFNVPVDFFLTNTADIYHTPLSYISSFFEFWSGTIRFHFQVIASSFHSVRLRVAWTPAPAFVKKTSLPAAQDPLDLSSVINRVVDITSNTEFDVDIPFVRELGMLKFYNDNSFDANGVLSVSVVNILTAGVPGATGVSPIEVNVWVSGLPDFQWGRPVGRFLSSFSPADAINPASFHDEADELLEGHSGPLQPSGLIPYKMHRQDGLLHGEDPKTLPELYRRYGSLGKHTSNSCNYSFGARVAWQGLNLSGIQKQAFFRSLAHLFRGFRGSMRLKCIFDSPTNTSIQFTSYSQPFNYQTPFIALFPVGVNMDDEYAYGLGYCPPSDNALPEATIPYYTNALYIPTDELSTTYDMSAPATTIKNFSPTTPITYLEAPGDDYQLIFFLGAPTQRVAKSMFLDRFPN
jgi:hypothetical protein